MMMKALATGGLEMCYNKRQEENLRRFATPEYKANPTGFYELANSDMRDPDFPQKYEGKLIKVLHGSLHRLKVGDYKIVYMLRYPKEICMSIKKVYGKNMTLDPNKYHKWMHDAQAYLNNRKDVDLILFKFSDVIKDPLVHFKRLKIRGWPIDPVKCASVVDPKLYRNR